MPVDPTLPEWVKLSDGWHVQVIRGAHRTPCNAAIGTNARTSPRAQPTHCARCRQHWRDSQENAAKRAKARTAIPPVAPPPAPVQRQGPAQPVERPQPAPSTSGVQPIRDEVIAVYDGEAVRVRSGCDVSGGCWDKIIYVGPDCDPGWLASLAVRFTSGEAGMAWTAKLLGASHAGG